MYLRTRRRLGIAICAAFIVAAGAIGHGQAVQTPLEGSMAALSEAVAGVVTTLAEHFGCDPASKVAYAGSVAETGWNVNVNGTYASQPVAVNITGALGEAFSIAYSGAYAGHPFSGVASLSSGRDIMLMSAASDPASFFLWDVHVIKNYRVINTPAGQAVLDDGLVVLTINGIPIAKYKQTSRFNRYPPFNRMLRKQRVAPAPGCVATLNEKPATGTISGKVTVKTM
jgi:hypothetical protein